MSVQASQWDILKCLLANARQLAIKPSLNLFFLNYLRRFRVQKAGKHLVLHSHLPPLNHPAYARFVDLHLRQKVSGPSHAQIGVTNACPQRCVYCYNQGRTGRIMDQAKLLQVIRELKDLGVVWLGITGGEPLLQKHLPELIASVGPDCAVKLFTTGCGLTHRVAYELKDAGLFSVSVSLDHWDEAVHNRNRGYPRAYAEALRAIEIFKGVGDLHVGVSTVLSDDMLKPDRVEKFLQFVTSLGADEAWLSETKPAVAAHGGRVIAQEEWQALVKFQDAWNRAHNLTMNYLGHFEDAAHFGCNAGHKMVYIDAFGEVSPCVFTPMSFGNVLHQPVKTVFEDMRAHFPSENRCFINAHYHRLQATAAGSNILNAAQTKQLVRNLKFGPYSKFFQLYYSRRSS